MNEVPPDSTQNEFLKTFGWDPIFDLPSAALPEVSLRPAKIISEERGLYRAQWSLENSCWAAISGKMKFGASHREDYPAVGDWVFLEVPKSSERGTIHAISARKTILHRRQVGSSGDKQILSTNVDFVFITTSINDELNHRRIERYLTIANESKVPPVILLTKADLEVGVPSEAATIRAQFPGVPVHTLSREKFTEAYFFEEYLETGNTAVVIGSSGVGKSTLVNYLIGTAPGEEHAKTQDIRESDGRGRHTTTSRSLYRTRFGGLIIDTPGMRELQLSEHVDGIKNHFEDIEALVASCKFSDCKHQSEPGCAIKKALADNSLDPSRWKNFLKLAEEVKVGVKKAEKNAHENQRRAWKSKTRKIKDSGAE